MIKEECFKKSGFITYRHEAVGLEEGDVEEIAALDDITLDDLAGKNSGRIAVVMVSEESENCLGEFNGYRWLWKYAVLKEAEVLPEEAKAAVYFLDEQLYAANEEKIKENAYILGKYSAVLREKGLFDGFFMMLLDEAKQTGLENTFIKTAESMISQGDEFCAADEDGPVITLGGEGLCGSVLDTFAISLAAELRKLGRAAVCMDVGEGIGNGEMPYTRALRWRLIAAARPRAVVGFQTDCFAENFGDGLLVGNLFKGIKFQFVFDHPLYICFYLMQPIENFYALCLDRDYAKYINDYIDNTKEAFFLPPAGEEGNLTKSGKKAEEKYSLSFIGKYYDYRDRLAEIQSYPEERRMRAQNLYELMMANPDMPIEEAFRIVLDKYEGKSPEDFSHNEYVAALHTIRDVGTAVKFSYREKVIKTILDAGIELHVFSEQWKDSPFGGLKNLIVHPEVEYTDSLDIMAQSKISLNVMSWHKAGMTERIANAMLNKSVCLTDKTRYLEDEFKDGEDIVFFDIKETEKLPGIIKGLLADEEKREKIKEAAYKKAKSGHTWEARAKAFDKKCAELN